MAFVSLPAYFVFAAALATRSSANHGVSCDLDIHGNCDPDHSLIDSSMEFSWWADQDLSDFCRELVDNIDCKQEYLEKCSNKTATFDFKAATQDLRDMLHEMLNETSDLRAAFRLHRECVRNLSDEYSGCMLSALGQTVTEMRENGNDLSDTESRILSLCRVLELVTECVTTTVERSCGQDAANFVGTILKRPFVTLRPALCEQGKFKEYFAYIDRRYSKEED